MNPFLFQVIGSTPAGIKENIKKSTLEGNVEAGIGLASSAVFAAAVNKATLENFLARPEMIHARPTISTAFSINGKTNMTGMTLLGHCLLTSSFLDEIVFVREFRHKMGQNNIWAGDLSSGSLSEKQKKIYLEKKRVTPEAAAKVLGSGFFKFIGVDRTPWTTAELDFWEDGETATTTNPKLAQPSFPPPSSSTAPNLRSAQYPPPLQKPSTGKQPEQPGPSSQQQTQAPMGTPPRDTARPPRSSPAAGSYVALFDVQLSDGSVVQVPMRAAQYYLSRHNNDLNELAASIESRKVASWIEVYDTAATRGLEAAMATGASTVGRT